MKLTPNKSITGRSSSVRQFEPWRVTNTASGLTGKRKIEDYPKQEMATQCEQNFDDDAEVEDDEGPDVGDKEEETQ